MDYQQILKKAMKISHDRAGEWDAIFAEEVIEAITELRDNNKKLKSRLNEHLNKLREHGLGTDNIDKEPQ